MANWKNTLIPKDSLVTGKGNCDFIFLPEGNCFEGAMISCPKKLIRPVKNKKKIVNISYSDEFSFPLYYMTHQGEFKRAQRHKALTPKEVDNIFAETHRQQFQAVRGLR